MEKGSLLKQSGVSFFSGAEESRIEKMTIEHPGCKQAHEAEEEIG